MLEVNFESRRNEDLKILCLGAHSDDIEIGCGGTILKMLQTRKDLSFCWVVFSGGPERAREAEASAKAFLQGAASKEIRLKNFRDGFFPFVGAEIKEYFEELKRAFEPHIVFTHTRDDRHQDHRLISDLTWNTFRDHLVLEYEITKYDGDLGSPNAFCHLDEERCRRKAQLLMEHFKTQRSNHWFSEETFLSILKIRGIESNSPGRYAEGFYVRKMVF
jgi:LmbE family N-acetylglucosaminyl deacetylase